MTLAIALGVGVREALVLSIIWEHAIASSQNVAQAMQRPNVEAISLINILRKKGLVEQHGVIDTIHPRPVGRPKIVKTWRITTKTSQALRVGVDPRFS